PPERLPRLAEIAGIAEGKAEQEPALVVVGILAQALAQRGDHGVEIAVLRGGHRIAARLIAGGSVAAMARAERGIADRCDGEDAGEAEGERGRAGPARGCGWVCHSG